jgi:hypothetical protein
MWVIHPNGESLGLGAEGSLKPGSCPWTYWEGASLSGVQRAFSFGPSLGAGTSDVARGNLDVEPQAVTQIDSCDHGPVLAVHGLT